MKALLCWLLGHERLTMGSRHRVCLRCGARETLRRYGSTIGWEEAARLAPDGPGGSGASTPGRVWWS
jgi:hypothetical protein